MRYSPFLFSLAAAFAQLVLNAGDSAIIPGWYLQSTANFPTNLSSLSLTGTNVSDWYRVSYGGTVAAGLIENGVYNDTELFFSDNLETLIDYSEYGVPWVYREEFNISTGNDQYYYLNTNWITSRADIYINGQTIATNDTQVGSYGGHRYDIMSTSTMAAIAY
jgi:exo-1,4-beta-D-glucosaminidase